LIIYIKNMAETLKKLGVTAELMYSKAIKTYSF